MELEQIIERPAGFWVRFGAHFIDSLLLSPLTLINFIIGQDRANWQVEAVTNMLGLLYWIIVPILWSGYTVGKRLLGIRIAKINGEKIGLGTMLLRHLLGPIIYIVTVGIGFVISGIMVVFRQDKRAIHDIIAGTYVSYNKP
jgi:uncharacterized RDD family membrane protein YckC